MSDCRESDPYRARLDHRGRARGAQHGRMADVTHEQLAAGEWSAEPRGMSDHELVALVVAVAALVRSCTALLRVVARARRS